MRAPSLVSLPSLLYTLSLLILLKTANAGVSDGCGKSLPTISKIGSTAVTTLTTDDGTQRSYRIYIPKLYSTSNPAPLIINYHGRSSSGQEQELMTGMSLPSWNNATIVIYPDGLNAEWQGDPDVHNVDDIAFTRNLVAKVSAQYCIDPSRIYAVGSSNGGGFVGNYLACSDWGASTFAVFGAAYGAFYTNTSDKICNSNSGKNNAAKITTDTVPIFCNSTKQDVPMIEFHGTGDQTIPYDGGDRRGLCLPAIPHWVTQWSSRTGLGSTNSSQSLFKGKAVKYEFGSGIKQGQVTHYEVMGMPHTWPVTTGNTAPFNATPVLMEFFQKWGPGDGKGVVNPSGTSSGTTAASASASSRSAAASISQSLLSPLRATALVWTLSISLFMHRLL